MSGVTRRRFIETTAKIGGLLAAATAAPSFVKRTIAEEKHSEYLKAKVNWRQAEGE